MAEAKIGPESSDTNAVGDAPRVLGDANKPGNHSGGDAETADDVNESADEIGGGDEGSARTISPVRPNTSSPRPPRAPTHHAVRPAGEL